MIPSVYVELDEIPINPVTGKLDRKSLPLPPSKLDKDLEGLKLGETASLQEQVDVMRTLWERVLLLDEGSISSESDFFDFGGHSLLAGN